MNCIIIQSDNNRKINLNPPESVVFIRHYSIITDEECCARKGFPNMFIYLDSEAGISRMVDIESVIVQSLVYHLIDYIPFVDTETNKMLKSLLQVSEHR